jgi:hypothetical protein
MPSFLTIIYGLARHLDFRAVESRSGVARRRVDGGVFAGADQCLAGVFVSAATDLSQQPGTGGDVWKPVVVSSVGKHGPAPGAGCVGVDDALGQGRRIQGRWAAGGDFRSFDGNWRARMSANRVNITNAEGWQYAYSRVRLACA